MHIVLLGREGLLGSDLHAVFTGEADVQIEAYSHAEFDVTDFARVRDGLPKADVVVNCTGERQIDEAERDRKGMFEVNMKGARNLALACKRQRSLLVHFSSHYVFDGEKQRTYTERDIPNPLNIYGASKLAADTEIRGVGGEYLIVRTQSLFGGGGPCFVNDLVTRLRKDDPVSVPDDEIIAPTYTVDLARAVLRLVRLAKRGLVNVASTGEASRFEVAEFLAQRLGSRSVLTPVKSRDLGRPARRPLYSVLETHWYRNWTGEILPEWRQAMDIYLHARGWV
jgi:dTDP-4-dehydrorhamnose reductase